MSADIIGPVFHNTSRAVASFQPRKLWLFQRYAVSAGRLCLAAFALDMQERFVTSSEAVKKRTPTAFLLYAKAVPERKLRS